MGFWRQISDISGQIWILCSIFNSETATNWISSLSFSVLGCRALCAERGLVLIHQSPSVLSTLHLLIPSLILLPSASLCLPAASSFTSLLLLIVSLLSSFTLLFSHLSLSWYSWFVPVYISMYVCTEHYWASQSCAWTFISVHVWVVVGGGAACFLVSPHMLVSVHIYRQNKRKCSRIVSVQVLFIILCFCRGYASKNKRRPACYSEYGASVGFVAPPTDTWNK